MFLCHNADRGLRITKVEKKHAGLFQCFATNPVGTVTSPAELKVMPKMITAMANDSSGKWKKMKHLFLLFFFFLLERA